ncbi:hypothetical protein JCM8115_000952 [Rhodotorula mucilaginosa]
MSLSSFADSLASTQNGVIHFVSLVQHRVDALLGNSGPLAPATFADLLAFASATRTRVIEGLEQSTAAEQTLATIDAAVSPRLSPVQQTRWTEAVEPIPALSSQATPSLDVQQAVWRKRALDNQAAYERTIARAEQMVTQFSSYASLADLRWQDVRWHTSSDFAREVKRAVTWACGCNNKGARVSVYSPEDVSARLDHVLSRAKEMSGGDKWGMRDLRNAAIEAETVGFEGPAHGQHKNGIAGGAQPAGDEADAEGGEGVAGVAGADNLGQADARGSAANNNELGRGKRKHADVDYSGLAAPSHVKKAMGSLPAKRASGDKHAKGPERDRGEGQGTPLPVGGNGDKAGANVDNGGQQLGAEAGDADGDENQPAAQHGKAAQISDALPPTFKPPSRRLDLNDLAEPGASIPRTKDGRVRWSRHPQVPELSWPLPPFVEYVLASRKAGSAYAGTDPDRNAVGLPPLEKARAALSSLGLSHADALEVILALQYEMISASDDIVDAFGYAVHDLLEYQDGVESAATRKVARCAFGQSGKENVPLP